MLKLPKYYGMDSSSHVNPRLAPIWFIWCNLLILGWQFETNISLPSLQDSFIINILLFHVDHFESFDTTLTWLCDQLMGWRSVHPQMNERMRCPWRLNKRSRHGLNERKSKQAPTWSGSVCVEIKCSQDS